MPVHQIKKILVRRLLSKKSAAVLLAVGIVITLHSLATVQSLSAAGGFQYVIILSGLLSLIWGVSELLPREYARVITSLRIGAFAILGIVLFILSLVFIFWWGMQQPK